MNRVNTPFIEYCESVAPPRMLVVSSNKTVLRNTADGSRGR